MKFSKLLTLIVVVFCCVSCQKKDQLGNLIGTWTFGACFVDGSGTPASGTINFGQTSSELEIWYVVEGDTLFKKVPIDYTETLEEVLVEFGTDNYSWERVVNKKKEQEFHFKEVVNQIEYKIVFDLIPH